jgi:hypothetical protein
MANFKILSVRHSTFDNPYFWLPIFRLLQAHPGKRMLQYLSHGYRFTGKAGEFPIDWPEKRMACPGTAGPIHLACFRKQQQAKPIRY